MRAGAARAAAAVRHDVAAGFQPGDGPADRAVADVGLAGDEIGLHRALGATKAHIRTQFLAEVILLSLAGGTAGIAAAAGATAFYAHAKGWALSSQPEPGPAASSVPSPDCCPPSAPPASPTVALADE